MAVTQRQIAEKLGISTTTICFVLNGQAAAKKINPETIKRVRAAQELGYCAGKKASDGMSPDSTFVCAKSALQASIKIDHSLCRLSTSAVDDWWHKRCAPCV